MALFTCQRAEPPCILPPHRSRVQAKYQVFVRFSVPKPGATGRVYSRDLCDGRAVLAQVSGVPATCGTHSRQRVAPAARGVIIRPHGTAATSPHDAPLRTSW